jgi:hypothetical protein
LLLVLLDDVIVYKYIFGVCAMGNEINNSGTVNCRTKNEAKFDQLFYGGIVVGMIVVVVGILTNYYYWAGITEARVILCSGLGIILGAFGSTATVKYRGIVITGVAAVTIVLSYVVVDQAAKTLTKDAFGTILGDFSRANLQISGDHECLGALKRHGKEYKFVVEGQIKEPNIMLDITFRDKNDKIMREPTYVIESKHINKYIGTGRKFVWSYDKEKDVIIDSLDEPIGKIKITKNYFRGKNYLCGFLRPRSWVLPSPAFAGTQRNLKDIFDDLTSESAKGRRDARSELADRGPSVVEPMMKEFGNHQNIYRIRLGVLVALTEMLRNNKSLSPAVSKELSSKDLELIVKALNDDDRTTRIYAGEFLYDLGDTRVVDPALESAKTSKEEGRYQSVFVIKGAFQELPVDKKALVKGVLKQIRPSSGDKTGALIDSILRME